MKWPQLTAFLVLAFLFGPFSVRAQGEVKLYGQGLQVDNYLTLLSNLQHADRLVFEGGHQFVFIDTLGCGNTTCVLEVVDPSSNAPELPLALRVPKDRGIFSALNLPYTMIVDRYIESSHLFEKADLSPRIRRFEREQFVLVDKITKEFDLDAFMTAEDRISPEVREKAEQSFLEFSKKLAAISQIEDFHGEQVVYDGERWWLIDILGGRSLSGSVRLSSWYSTHPLERLREAVEKHLVDQLMDTSYMESVFASAANVFKNEKLRILALGTNPASGEKVVYKPEDRFRADPRYKAIALLKKSYSENCQVALVE